jgi:hypothetical protein
MLTLVKSRTEPAAGRGLDLEVARVLGMDPSKAVPPYSKERGFYDYIKLEIDGGWTVEWIGRKQPLHHSMKPIQSTAPTRALAICRSILKVVDSVKGRGNPPDRPR